MSGDVVDPDAPLCGDPTCRSYACTMRARDDWEARQEKAARDYVRGWFREVAEYNGLPLPAGWSE